MPIQNLEDDLDWTEDWTGWLAGDRITASVWIVPDGLAKGADGFDNTTATVWLGPGTVPGKYTVKNKIVTLAGRRGTKTRKFRVRDI